SLDGTTDLAAENRLGHGVCHLPDVSHDVTGHTLPLELIDLRKFLELHILINPHLFELDEQRVDQVLLMLVLDGEPQVLGVIERNVLGRKAAPQLDRFLPGSQLFDQRFFIHLHRVLSLGVQQESLALHVDTAGRHARYAQDVVQILTLVHVSFIRVVFELIFNQSGQVLAVLVLQEQGVLSDGNHHEFLENLRGHDDRELALCINPAAIENRGLQIELLQVFGAKVILDYLAKDWIGGGNGRRHLHESPRNIGRGPHLDHVPAGNIVRPDQADEGSPLGYQSDPDSLFGLGKSNLERDLALVLDLQCRTRRGHFDFQRLAGALSLETGPHSQRLTQVLDSVPKLIELADVNEILRQSIEMGHQGDILPESLIVRHGPIDGAWPALADLSRGQETRHAVLEPKFLLNLLGRPIAVS